jgi:hypothetical protein
VVSQLLDAAQRYAELLPDVGQLVGPAGAVKPGVEVVEVGLGYRDTERFDPHR